MKNGTSAPRKGFPDGGKTRLLWPAFILLGILLRILIVVLPGHQIRAPWSGGGDAFTYVLLAQNLLSGRGFTYALQPTALRAPGYPLLLAGLISLFHDNFVMAIRALQFALGLGTVYFCARASSRAFGEQAGRATFLLGLFFPTLIYVTGEVLTECIGAFLAAVFLYLLTQELLHRRMATLAGMGILTGVAALFRFNMAGLGFVGLFVAYVVKTSRPAWQRILVFACCAGMVISPWLIRNQIAFQGAALYSTLSGHDAVEGVLTPQGRALPGDDAKIKGAEGWILSDIETNAPSRRDFGPEPVLNHQAWTAALALWRQRGLRLLPVELAKLSYFWLSTDQLASNPTLSIRQNLLRWSGVVAYWALLLCGIIGFFRMRKSAPLLALTFLAYVLLLTALHTPFPMITRLRIPFMDPLIAILAGGAFSVDLRGRKSALG